MGKATSAPYVSPLFGPYVTPYFMLVPNLDLLDPIKLSSSHRLTDSIISNHDPCSFFTSFTLSLFHSFESLLHVILSFAACASQSCAQPYLYGFDTEISKNFLSFVRVSLSRRVGLRNKIKHIHRLRPHFFVSFSTTTTQHFLLCFIVSLSFTKDQMQAPRL